MIRGLNSIVRLVTQLEDRIEDLSTLRVSQPQRTIRAQAQEIKRLRQAFDNKAAQLIEAQRLNRKPRSRFADYRTDN